MGKEFTEKISRQYKISQNVVEGRWATNRGKEEEESSLAVHCWISPQGDLRMTYLTKHNDVQWLTEQTKTHTHTHTHAQHEYNRLINSLSIVTMLEASWKRYSASAFANSVLPENIMT